MKKRFAIPAALLAVSTFGATLDFTLSANRRGGEGARAGRAGETVVREMRLPRELLPEARGLAEGETVDFRLFDDATLSVKLSGGIVGSDGTKTFQGDAGGVGFRNAVVMVGADNSVQAYLPGAEGHVYVVSTHADGAWVRELCAKGGVRRSTELEPPKAVADPGAPARLPADDLANDESFRHVDILLVYDERAATWALDNGYGLLAFAQMQIAKMNLALANTDLDSNYLFRLKGVQVLDGSLGTETGTAVSSVRWGDTTEDGLDLGVVHDKRDEVGADIVCVLIDTGSAYGTTGTGFSLHNTGNPASFASSAYCACAIQSVVDSHTMTHEIGHNMGAGHSAEQESSPGPQSYDYSCGYYFSTAGGRTYHTIMAYDDEYIGGDEIPYFSSPIHHYKGYAVGNSTHDNTRALRNLYKYVADFRAETAADPASTVFRNVVVSPAGGTVFELGESLEVQLEPVQPGGAVYYTLDGSTPTTSSLRYTQPFTVTATTTVRAIAVVDGIAGSVRTATYFVNDLGAGIDLPILRWTQGTKGDWSFHPDESCTGGACICSRDDCFCDMDLSTRLRGPGTLSFKYKTQFLDSTFSFTVNGSLQLYVADDIPPTGATWKTFSLTLGAGDYDLCFAVARGGSYYSSGYNGVSLDAFSWTGEIPTYTVSFDACGGTAVPSRECALDGPVGSLPESSRTGYAFAGWQTSPTGGDKVSAETIVSADSTYYAHWTALRYPVGFNANGGTGTMSDVTMTYDATAPLPGSSFTRKGYRFVGWATSAAGPVKYAAGTSVKNLSAGTRVVLYAMWEVALRPELYPGLSGADGAPSSGDAPDLAAASVYDCFVFDDASVVGSLQVKVAKGRLDRTTGESTSKVTATFQPVDGSRKVTFRNGQVGLDGRVTKMSAEGRTLALRLGARGAGGSLVSGGQTYGIDGSRNLFKLKDGESAAAVREVAQLCARPFAVVFDNAADGRGMVSAVPGSAGKVKIAGLLADGTKISATSQVLVGGEWLCIPLVAPKARFACCLWVSRADGSVEVDGLADLVRAGRTGTALGATVDFGTIPEGLFRLPTAKDEALKLTLAAKTGAVKGSFKLGRNVKGKTKKIAVSVNGYQIGTTAYLTATIRRVGSWPMSVR